ncbi:DNA-binding PadR family transcriptional regulator [Clostridium beijerinckii]|nr:DNA-binding PadR family transcriptional regulator [Clostridium beijerinckii]
MSSINLIILGYLQNKEKSAYEMVKEFDKWNLTKCV